MTSIDTSPIIQALEEKTKGLFFRSKVNFPFKIFHEPPSEPLKNYFLKLSGRHEYKKIEETSIKYLFRNTTTLREPHREDWENVDMYLNFLDFLLSNFDNIKVFRTEGTEVDVFITGISEEGHFITLWTRSIE